MLGYELEHLADILAQAAQRAAAGRTRAVGRDGGHLDRLTRQAGRQRLADRLVLGGLVDGL